MRHTSERLQSIQALRGVAALAVVFYHVSTLSLDYINGAVYTPLLLIGKAGVDLFFVISGFVMVHTTYRKFDDQGTASRFAIARISRIYPSYWFLTFLVFLYWLHSPASVNSKHGGADPVSSFLLLPSPLLPLVPVAWTLIFEVFFYFVFWILLILVSRRYLLAALCIWALACALNTIASWEYPEFFLRSVAFSPFNLEFIAGSLLAMIPNRRFGWFAILAGGLWFGSIAVYFAVSGQSDSMPIHVRISLYLVPSVLLVFGFLAIERSGVKFPSIMVLTGDFSYSLYLTHILVIHLVYRLISRYLLIEWNIHEAWSLFFVLVAMSMFIGYMYYKTIERPLSSEVRRFMIKHLLGKRTSEAN